MLVLLSMSNLIINRYNYCFAPGIKVTGNLVTVNCNVFVNKIKCLILSGVCVRVDVCTFIVCTCVHVYVYACVRMLERARAYVFVCACLCE